MVKEKRTVCYDAELEVEAYRFEGIMQKFPHHFHDYYVFGFIEEGERFLECNQREYIIYPGDMIIFNPGVIHSCEQIDDHVLDYRCLNIGADRMLRLAYEIGGREDLPVFEEPVLRGTELAASLKEVHQWIVDGETDFMKEEAFFVLMGQLIQDYSGIASKPATGDKGNGFRNVCEYMKSHFPKKITLDELSGLAGLSKYHFIRSFTREMGISPYNYLETIRVGAAKKLLEQGVTPAAAAQCTGFSDQSHFTHFFKRYIGLTPGQYMKIFREDAATAPAGRAKNR